MRAGSLVICVNATDAPYIIKGEIYTILEIIPWGSLNEDGTINGGPSNHGIDGCTLVEIPHLDYHIGIGYRIAYSIVRFREVVPPMQKEIEELLKEPEYEKEF